jgi:hypothetical protein
MGLLEKICLITGMGRGKERKSWQWSGFAVSWGSMLVE